MTVEIEIGDDVYEVDVRHFEPASPYRWGEAPEGGEIELDETVTLVAGSDLPYSGRHRQRVPMERLLDVYADDRGIEAPTREETRKIASIRLHDECYEDVMRQVEDDFDDREV